MQPVSLTLNQGTNPGEFDGLIRKATGTSLNGTSLETVQVNIGLTCNLACHHCHVESSPSRREQMDWPTMLQVLEAAHKAGASTIDITGGAPEMNPHFRPFVAQARRAGRNVMVRTNLTILLEAGYEDLPEFFVAHGVHLVASLPCYLEQNVDRQRGKDVYAGSIKAIQRLNALGYGVKPDLELDLVYNPLGPHLPPAPEGLEVDYRRALAERFGIRFTRLITITNMAIGRFLHDLQRQGQAEKYQQMLRESFNAQTLSGLMCRHQIHISWDGSLHDCDFNYGLALRCHESLPAHVRDFDPDIFRNRSIAVGEHCFGCTAGRGSSCGGVLA